MTTGPEVLKTRLQAGEHLAGERRELGAAMIDRRLRHRAQHAIGRIGRAGNLQEVAAGLYTTGDRNQSRSREVRGTEVPRYQQCVVRDFVPRPLITVPRPSDRESRDRIIGHSASVPAIDVEALRRDLEAQIEGEVRFDTVLARSTPPTPASTRSSRSASSSSQSREDIVRTVQDLPAASLSR